MGDKKLEKNWGLILISLLSNKGFRVIFYPAPFPNTSQLGIESYRLATGMNPAPLKVVDEGSSIK
jgi:hypothetical protein